MDVARLRIRLLAEIDDLRSRLLTGEGLVQKFSGVAVAALLAVSAAAFAAGLAIDNALDGIRVGTGATGGALTRLETDFDRTFAGVPDSAANASVAITGLGQRTGQTGAGLQALSTQVLTLSRITGTDLKANISGASRAFGDWGIAARDQADTLDLVFRASQATGIGVDTLLAKLVQYGAPLRQLGFSFVEAAALMGKFEREGVNAELVLGSLRIALGNFAKAGKDAPAALQATVKRIQELGPSSAATALAIETFGKRAGPDMAAAILEGRLAIDDLVQRISTGTDTIAAAARDTDGFSENLAILRNRATQALEPFGTRILDVFNRAILVVMENGDKLAGILHRVGQVAILLASILLGRLVPGFLAATAAAVAHGAALVGVVIRMGAAAIAARALAGTLGLLRGILAFFGGPIGLLASAVLAGVGVAFLNAGRRAREAAADARRAADEFEAALGRMDDATVGRTFDFKFDSLARAGAALNEVRDRVRELEGMRLPEFTITATTAGTVAKHLTDHGIALQRARAEQERLSAVETTARTHWRLASTELGRRTSAVQAATAATASPGSAEEDAAAKGATYAQMLRERADLLVQVFDAERAAGRDTTSVVGAMVQVFDQAAAALRGMGDAATLSPTLLADYEALLSTAAKLRELGATQTGPASVRAAVGQSAPRAPDAGRPALPSLPAEWGSYTSQIVADARAAAGFVTEQAGRWREALRDGSKSLKEAAADLRGVLGGMRDQLISALPQQVGDFVGRFREVRDARAEKVAAAVRDRAPSPALGPAPLPAAAGMMVLMELLSGVAETLGPALAGLLFPVRLVGELLGTMLIPIIKLLFPPLKFLAIVVTYLAEGIGWAVRSIGKVIDVLPFVSGGPIIRAGQSIMDGAEAVRKRLEDMTFEDAVEQAKNAERAARAMVNVVDGFKASAYRFAAADPRGSVPPPRTPGSGAGGGGGYGPGAQPQSVTYSPTQHITIVQQPGEDPEQFARRVVRIMAENPEDTAEAALQGLKRRARARPESRALVAQLVG